MVQGSCDVIHLTSSILLLSCLISSDFAPPWARNFFLVGARISSLKLPLHLKCSGKGTTRPLRFSNPAARKIIFSKINFVLTMFDGNLLHC